MLRQLKPAERRISLFKKLLQSMLDIIPQLLKLDLESEMKEMLKNSLFLNMGELHEHIFTDLLPELRNAMRRTELLAESLPKWCDMTQFQYPSREIKERSVTLKNPIVPLITSNTEQFEGKNAEKSQNISM